MPAHLVDFWALIAVGLILIGIGVTACLRVMQQPPLLPRQRIRSVPWNGAFCFLTIILIYAPREIAASLFPKNLPAGLIAAIASLPIALTVLYIIVREILGSRAFTDHWRRRDVVLGFAAWFAFGGVALIVHLITRWIGTQFGHPSKSDHVFITALQDHGNNTMLWTLITIEAVVCAPIREEVLFRGIIQGWATSRRLGGEIALVFACFAALTMRGGDHSMLGWLVPPLFAAIVGGGLFAAEPMLRPILRLARNPLLASNSFRGIVGTALLFAMFHVSSWPDPVPLTVLGLSLGWLAWRTQSLGACIVCHSLFNLTTLMQLRLIQLMNASAGP